MEDIKLLFSSNENLPRTKISIINSRFVFRESGEYFQHETIYNILKFVNTILVKYPGQKLPIVFEIKATNLRDKLTYILFECICVYLIEHCGYQVHLDLSSRYSIYTAGIKSSPLQLLTTNSKDDNIKFVKKFYLDISSRRYRRVLTKSNPIQPDSLCKIMDDIATFQIPFGVSDDCRNIISEVIIELIGNACEHGDSNCLIDFDIAPFYRKNGSESEFVGINICIINFSNQLLGTSLRRKILSDKVEGTRYELVKNAHVSHKEFFSKYYCEEDFFNMTAFQHKISGRCDSVLTGGTGLTKLIESLEVRSDSHKCYVLSGRRCVVFRDDYLSYSKDGWIGFNKDNDYFNTPPDWHIFAASRYNLPGTAYNLTFVLEKENQYGK